MDFSKKVNHWVHMLVVLRQRALRPGCGARSTLDWRVATTRQDSAALEPLSRSRAFPSLSCPRNLCDTVLVSEGDVTRTAECCFPLVYCIIMLRKGATDFSTVA
jgi:hypothetical protein